MIVVDASLATKWFLNEADSERARAFLHERRGQLCGPDMLAIEVGRALVAAVNARRVDAGTMRSAIDLWLERMTVRALRLYPTHVGLIQRGVDIALELGHPLVDCLYLALALELGCDLVTCDAKFRTKAAVPYPGVRLLADFN